MRLMKGIIRLTVKILYKRLIQPIIKGLLIAINSPFCKDVYLLLFFSLR